MTRVSQRNTTERYYAGVDSLGLAHGDQTGMWMLNYPFPYDSVHVQETFTTMNHALLHALQAPSGATLAQSLDIYRRARQAFRESAPADGVRYFAFQLWQEGVARSGPQVRVRTMTIRRHVSQYGTACRGRARRPWGVVFQPRVLLKIERGPFSLER